MMDDFSRRAFLGGSLVALETLRQTVTAIAAPQCVTGTLPGFLPNRLTVDCASRLNFRLFRKNSAYLGLAGAVSMSFVRGKRGSYAAGNLFLFPWLKPKGRALGQNTVWPSVAPTSATQYAQASPIPDLTLPVDEYFCRIVVQAPWTSFIGFMVDEPFGASEAGLGWFSNVDKLADGQGVGIDWTSANLNHTWFGGSRFIPNTDDCNGRTWRQVIASALSDASTGVC